MSDRSSKWANVGVTLIDWTYWVTFRRWYDDPNTDQFWDGTKWVGSPEEALVHEGFSTALEDMFQPHVSAPTEEPGQGTVNEINKPRSRESLESQHGQVWDTQQLAADFEVLGFDAPLVRVRRKLNGKKGSFVFQPHPRSYFLYVDG